MQKGIFLHTIFLNGRDDALRIFFLKQRTQLINRITCIHKNIKDIIPVTTIRIYSKPKTTFEYQMHYTIISNQSKPF